MAALDLRKQFRQQLNQYQHIEQWLGNHLRRRAKTDDWLRNRLIRSIVLDGVEASDLNERLAAANPTSSRVDFFRGVFDTLPTGKVPSEEFDYALDNVDAMVTTCAFIQSQGPRLVRKLPKTYAVPDFVASLDFGGVLVQSSNLRGYMRELFHLFDAVSAASVDHPCPDGTGLLVYGSKEYLDTRFEGGLRWEDGGLALVSSFDERSVIEAMDLALSNGQSKLAEGLFGLQRSEGAGIRLTLLPPDEQTVDEDNPFLRCVELEISTNVGWMHNHALANEFQDGYQLFVDATRIDSGTLETSQLDRQLSDYMGLMWDTNAMVSVFIKTDQAQLEYRAPQVPAPA
jgi:hypothetical protein